MRALLLSVRVQLALGVILCALPGCGGCTPPASQTKSRTEQSVPPERESRTTTKQTAKSSSSPKSKPRAEQPADLGEGASAGAGMKSGARNNTVAATPGGDSPESAFSSARDLQSSADTKRKNGDHKGAFEDASRAFGLVRRFPDDPDCRSLADALLRDLEALESLVDVGGGVSRSDSKPLILQ